MCLRLLLPSIGHRFRLLLGVMAASAVLGLLGVSNAQAYTGVSYSCGILDPGTWCIDNVRHTYVYNDADYPGSGSVFVCEKTIRDSDKSQYQQSCGYNFASSWFSNCCTLLLPGVYQSGPNRHTIDGFAQY